MKCVYIIYNKVSKKGYVGSTTKHKRRFSDHLANLYRNKHSNSYLQNAWNKYGKSNFEFRILEEVCNSSQLLIREQYYIDTLKSCNHKFGYNICPKAGNTLGVKFSERTKKLMRSQRQNRGMVYRS